MMSRLSGLARRAFMAVVYSTSGAVVVSLIASLAVAGLVIFGIFGAWITHIFVNIGMWYERFVIIITSVAHDFIPHNWGLFAPSMIEYGIMLGSFCLFFFLFLLFATHLPSVSMTEMKETLDHGGSHAG